MEIIVIILLGVIAGLIIKLAKKSNHDCPMQQGYNFLERLAEQGSLAQEVIDLKDDISASDETIDTAINEMHSIAFFDYLKTEKKGVLKAQLFDRKHYFAAKSAEDASNLEYKKLSDFYTKLYNRLESYL